ncbi:MAG TPA: hypothetical protein VMT51_15665 [Dongiaceae bacterium]|nr:hypothetical protein [Dongiaceae bacterium]
MILAKVAAGVFGTIFLAGAYTFREGVIRVDVDEYKDDGAHVHLWVPAAAVPTAMRFVPDENLREASAHVKEFGPVARALAKELRNYPNTTFVEVEDQNERTHVRVSTDGARIKIDVDDPDENVHVAVPLATLDDVLSQLESRAKGL